MKNIKRTVAVFVSAIMVMAMLAGCGSGSIGDQLRKETGADANGNTNKIAIALATDGNLSSLAVEAVMTEIYGEDNFSGVVYNDSAYLMAWVGDVETADEVHTIIIKQYTGSTEEQIVADVKGEVDVDDMKETYGEGFKDVEVYIGASSSANGTYVVVVDIACSGYTAA